MDQQRWSCTTKAAAYGDLAKVSMNLANLRIPRLRITERHLRHTTLACTKQTGNVLQKIEWDCNSKKSNGIETYMCQPNLSCNFKDRKIFNVNSSIVWQWMYVNGKKTCSSAMNFENLMGTKLTCVNQIYIAVSRTEQYLISSRASSGNECYVDGQKTCSSANEFRKSNGNETYMCQPIKFCCFKDRTIFDPSLASLMSSRAWDCHTFSKYWVARPRQNKKARPEAILGISFI